MCFFRVDFWRFIFVPLTAPCFPDSSSNLWFVSFIHLWKEPLLPDFRLTSYRGSPLPINPGRGSGGLWHFLREDVTSLGLCVCVISWLKRFVSFLFRTLWSLVLSGVCLWYCRLSGVTGASCPALFVFNYPQASGVYQLPVNSPSKLREIPVPWVAVWKTGIRDTCLTLFSHLREKQ